jgi:hypothetical protein
VSLRINLSSVRTVEDCRHVLTTDPGAIARGEIALAEGVRIARQCELGYTPPGASLVIPERGRSPRVRDP